jgi:RES domain-containing protein
VFHYLDLLAATINRKLKRKEVLSPSDSTRVLASSSIIGRGQKWRSRLVWRIATNTPDYKVSKPTGKGAKGTGGRWNRKSSLVDYCAESIAQTKLERFVHLDSGPLPLTRYLMRAVMPGDIWNKATSLRTTLLPIG